MPLTSVWPKPWKKDTKPLKFLKITKPRVLFGGDTFSRKFSRHHSTKNPRFKWLDERRVQGKWNYGDVGEEVGRKISKEVINRIFNVLTLTSTVKKYVKVCSSRSFGHVWLFVQYLASSGRLTKVSRYKIKYKKLKK